MFKAPAKPKNILFGHKLVRAEWEANQPMITDFDVEYRAEGSHQSYRWDGVLGRTGTRSFATIIGLRPATEYQIRVRGKWWLFKTPYSQVLNARTLRP